ncbi:hypothetical protein CRENBAI_005071 [Crenichthys baileyi]|uniref:Uncharacterized protein n=1 Tax=Crenichthys baileyi TaxID=28760 RepID=A0AAV9QX26_9TELE
MTQSSVVIDRCQMLGLGGTSFVWSVAFCFLQAPLPRLGCKVDRETARASEREALTSGTRCGNNGDAPQGDSGRQEQAQTQEPAPETDLPRPENLEEELSLAHLLSFFSMP